MTTYTSEQIQMVIDLMSDGRRIDRLLRRCEDGTYYVTADKTYLTNDGPETPPYVYIPCVDDDISDEEMEECAVAYLDELTAMVS